MDDADREQIAALIAAADRAQDDVGVLPALHTADAVVVNIAGRRVVGRRALAEAMAAAMRSTLSAVRTQVAVDEVRVVADDVALVLATKTVLDERATGGDLPTTGTMTYVVRRGGEGWQIALAQTTPAR